MSTSISEMALQHPRASAASVDDRVLHLTLTDGRELRVPVAWFAWLEAGTPAQRANLEIIEDGAGIWWDSLDDGLSVPRLFGLPEWP